MTHQEHNDAIAGKFDLRAALAALSFLLWVASLFTLAVTEAHGEDTVPVYGFGLLIFGPLGAAVGQFGWYANPLMLWTMLQLFYRQRPFTVATLELLLAGSTFFWTTDHDFFNKTELITGHGIGFYFWLSSATLLAIATFIPLSTHTAGEASLSDERPLKNH